MKVAGCPRTTNVGPDTETCVGSAPGEEVGVNVGDGGGECVADADAEAEGDAALGAAWLLLSDDKQPAIDNEATIISTILTNNFFIIKVPL